MKEPIMIGDVEVVNIDPTCKSFRLHVHLNGVAPNYMVTPLVQGYISHRVKYAVEYMIAEGFIPDPNFDDWQLVIAGICHPKIKLK